MSTVLFVPVVFLIVVLTVGVAVGLPLLLLWIATRNRHVPGPRFLGVCWRLAEKRGVAVGQVRMLAALAIILSGIVPGLLGYLLLAIFMEQWAGPQEMASPPLPPQSVSDVRSPAAPRPFAGPERIGRYTVTGLIGRGGMGTVYRGHDDALDRDVAVKVIHDRFGHSENVLRRFGEEAKNVARLSSPHIVHVHEFDPLATPPFLAMELVRGPSLQQLIRGRGRASFATVLDCARQMLAGLATAHSAGIVHRDIKPANVLRGPDGTYKLTDFGLARSLEREQSLTATGSIIGTLHYMAPEVAAGEEATASSDLYSVGVTLYEMLAGTTPFPEESPLKLLRRIAAERPLPVTAHRDGIPPQLEAWLAKLLAHDPGSRFPSAAASLDALRQVEIPAAAADDYATLPFDVEACDATAPTAAMLRLDGPSPAPIHRDQVDSIIRSALRLEAQGRSLLGDDTVLEIARELHVESRFVRRALADHRAAKAPPLPQLPPPPSRGLGCGIALAALIVGGVLVGGLVFIWLARAEVRVLRAEAAAATPLSIVLIYAIGGAIILGLGIVFTVRAVLSRKTYRCPACGESN
jgi:serine/threonine protein kinase/phage shock protein PspC (stress-responsive transcriptional regulator)